MNTSIRFLIAAALLSACGGRPDFWTERQAVLGPVSAAGRLVWLHAPTGMLTAIDPSGGLLHVDLTDTPRALAATTAGVVAVGGRGDAPILDVVALPGGEQTSIALPGAYDHVSVSPDGRYAVLFYDPSRTPAIGGPAARNNNEVSVVDLQAGTAAAIPLQTESIAPEAVLFSPGDTVAAIVLDGAVAFIDLANPTFRTHVPLKLPGGEVLAPREAHFSPGGDYLYIRTGGTDDVLALEVQRTGRGISSAINFLFFPGGRGLSDILVAEDGAFGSHVVAVFRTSRHVALLEQTGDTAKARSLSLSREVTDVAEVGDGRLVLFNDPAKTTRANTRGVAGWAPFDERFDEDLLQGTIGVRPSVGSGGAFFVHSVVDSNGGVGTALSQLTLLDDGSRLTVRLSPIVLSGAVTASAMHASTGSLFLAVSIPRKDSGAAPRFHNDEFFDGQVTSLVRLELATGAIFGMPLDHTAYDVGFVGDHLYALHQGALGDVSFASTATFDRASARRATGFLLGGLMDLGDAR